MEQPNIEDEEVANLNEKPLNVSLTRASSTLPNTSEYSNSGSSIGNTLQQQQNRNMSPTILAGGNETRSRINSIGGGVVFNSQTNDYDNIDKEQHTNQDDYEEDDIGSSSSNNNNNSNSNNNNNNNSNNKLKYNNSLMGSYQSSGSGHIIIVTDSDNNNNNRHRSMSNSQMYNSGMVSSYTSDYLYSLENYEARAPEKIALPFTFHRAMVVVIMVIIYLMLITSFFIEYRFIDQSTVAYYAYLVTRPLPMIPLLLIIPLYGVNDAKTMKYSLFISAAIVCNTFYDAIFSVDVSVTSSGPSSATDSPGNTNYGEILYYISFAFTLLSRLFYTIAFIIGIGKNIKIRLFHALPFYAYSATLVLMIVFSKQIAPVLIPPRTPYLRSGMLEQSITDIAATATSSINDTNGQDTSSYIETSSSTYPNELDATHFSLIIIYAVIEATALWRALALTSSFPGTNPTRLLLWLSVLGATVFAITDTLIVISNFYYPLTGIFYYSSGGYWLGHSLIVFSIPRRMDLRDYKYKYINQYKDQDSKEPLIS